VTDERQQPALVTCHEIIGLPCFGQGQKEIIGRIGGAFDVWQCVDGLGEILQLVDQAADLIGLDARGDRGLAQRSPQLVELLWAVRSSGFNIPASACAKSYPAGKNFSSVGVRSRIVMARTPIAEFLYPFKPGRTRLFKNGARIRSMSTYNQTADKILEAVNNAVVENKVSPQEIVEVLVDLAASTSHIVAGEQGLHDAITRFQYWIEEARSGRLPFGRSIQIQ
jgi:hypothetical protein